MRRLAITVGDPRGIGPELVAHAVEPARWREAVGADDIEPLVVGPLGVACPVDDVIGTWGTALGGSPLSNGTLNDSAVSDSATRRVLAGQLAGRAIERAVALIQSGQAEGLVTAPIDKRALADAGYPFPGHTEMLAALTGCATTMMLASDRLRVVLVTTHLALRDVPDAVTHSAILDAAERTRRGLQDAFGIAAPRLALCALNPHAGDGGRFGDEDDRVLAPAARAAGLTGPLPADTVFVRALRGEFDAVLAPVHDVGMTAIKVASFGSAVNITLGLPFPRTSPDHGTAIDIAGQGIADPSSFLAAVRLAAELLRRPAVTR